MHGLSIEKLKQKKAEKFTKKHANEILDFIGNNARLIAHNFTFDRKVLLAAFKSVKVWF